MSYVGILEPEVDEVKLVSKCDNFEEAQAAHGYTIGEFSFTIHRAYADSCSRRSNFFYIGGYMDEIFQIDKEKGFRTPESAAIYLDNRVYNVIKRMSLLKTKFWDE